MANPVLPVQVGQVSQDVYNSCAPKEGPKTIPVIVSLAGDAQQFDFLLQVTRGIISQIQGVYIDNKDNSESVTLTSITVNQSITVQANAQGYFPILSGNPPRFEISSAGTAQIGLQFFNFPISPLQWGAIGGGGSSVDLTADDGVILTPDPITGTGSIGAKVDGITIGFDGSGALEYIGGFPTPPSGANPTATAGPTVVNGAASTFMRSDAAPAVQKASASQFGIVEVDNVTIKANAGVISAQSPYASVFLTNSQTGIVSGTVTKILYDTVDFDPNNWWDAINHRMVPNIPGKYRVTAALTMPGGVTAIAESIELLKNGALYAQAPFNVSSTNILAILSLIVPMNGTTDFLEADGIVTSSNAISFLGSTVRFTWFDINYLGP